MTRTGIIGKLPERTRSFEANRYMLNYKMKEGCLQKTVVTTKVQSAPELLSQVSSNFQSQYQRHKHYESPKQINGKKTTILGFERYLDE